MTTKPKITNPFPTNVEILRALKLPTTYRVSRRVRADINVSNVITTRMLYEIDSPTAGHVRVKAAWTPDAGAVEIGEDIFRQLIAIAFGIRSEDLPAKLTNVGFMREHFMKHGTKDRLGDWRLGDWVMETTTSGHFASFWDSKLNRAGVNQIADALGITLPNPKA